MLTKLCSPGHIQLLWDSFVISNNNYKSDPLAFYNVMCDIFRDKSKYLKDAICADIDCPNSCCIGAKTKVQEEKFDKWQAKEYLGPLETMCMCIDTTFMQFFQPSNFHNRNNYGSLK